MTPSFSVIIPTYNRADLIGETLASVYAQTLAPSDVIVIDDGSTDDTEARIRADWPKVHYQRVANSGQVHARNVGAKIATGNWLCFLDSDDLWHPAFLETAAELIGETGTLNYLFSNFCHVIDDVWQTETKLDQAPADFWPADTRALGDRFYVAPSSLYLSLLRYQPIFPSSAMIPRHRFDHLKGWDERVGRSKSEDFEFHLRAVRDGAVGVIRSPLVGVRKHAGNHSGNRVPTMLGQIWILDFARSHHRPDAPIRAEIDHQILIRARDTIDIAFAEEKWEGLEEAAHWLPMRERLMPKVALKRLIAKFPAPLRGRAAHALLSP